MCKILVVDDKPDVLSTLTGLLADSGYMVRFAANEGDAWTAILEDEFDFAVIDVRLRGDDEKDESGLTLAMGIRTLNPRMRIILITGFKIEAQQVARAVRYHGAIDFIEKGPDIGRLIVEAIEKACKEPGSLQIAGTPDETRLSLSLIVGQPLLLRAHGHYVRSAQTENILRVDVERYARSTELARKNAADIRFQVEEIGNRLWQELFATHRQATEVYFEAHSRSNPLTLIFETYRGLVRLPLEFVRSASAQEYLVLEHPFSRFILDVTPKREAFSPLLMSRFTKTRKLRVLLIASNTKPSIPSVDLEIKELTKFFNQSDIPVKVTSLSSSQASYGRIRDELGKTDYDIIHYAGHGSFDAHSPEESFLLFWEDGGKQESLRPMKATELKLLLDQSEARLVYLSCCYSTTTADQTALLDDDFLGLADAVVHAGVPSALGFRWPVSDDGARKLALAFYRSLLDQGRPDVALWHARRELAVDRNDHTWLSPILIHQE
jgi:CheY-like chemotaxis protein